MVSKSITGRTSGAERGARGKTQPQQRRQRIGELLIEGGLITPQHLEEALALQRTRGGKTVQNLVALNYLNSQQFMEFLARNKGIACINLQNYCLSSEFIDLIPADFARKHEIVPVDKMGKNLTLAMACPLDTETIDELQKTTGLRIRPLLVSMDAIRSVLDQYYPEPRPGVAESSVPASSPVSTAVSGADLRHVDSAMTIERVLQLVRNVQSLPALPVIVQNVRNMMEDPETSTTEVAREIAKDPALTAKVLSLANSSAYAFARTVDSVPLATALLGLREVYSMVLSATVMRQFSRSQHFDYERFWEGARFCATTAKVIARTSGYKPVEGVFAAGLLHDMGRLVFAELMPERYRDIGPELSDTEVLALENARFGLAHPEIGYVLATEWALPPEIAEPIRFHHNLSYAETRQDLIAILAIGARITNLRSRPSQEIVSAVLRESPTELETIRLTETQLVSVVDISKAVAAADLV